LHQPAAQQKGGRQRLTRWAVQCASLIAPYAGDDFPGRKSRLFCRSGFSRENTASDITIRGKSRSYAGLPSFSHGQAGFPGGTP